MSDEQEVAVLPTQNTLPSLTEVQGRVDEMLANRKYMIEKVKPLLTPGIDIYELPGVSNKPSLGKPGAEKLAAIFKLRATFKVDRDTIDMIGAAEGDKKYAAYVCTLTFNGEFAGEGRGATFVEWTRNSYKRIFNSDKKNLTPEETKALLGPFKATSKTGAPYEFWKLPEEPVFDPLALNKAIKMAQKSAFVDAVIRTTGMSDLFTQDIEDMKDLVPEEPTATPTKAVTPPPTPPAPPQAPVKAEVVPPAQKDRPALMRELHALLKDYGMPHKAFNDAYQVDSMNDISDELIAKAIPPLRNRVKAGEQWQDPNLPIIEVDAPLGTSGMIQKDPGASASVHTGEGARPWEKGKWAGKGSQAAENMASG